MLGELPCIVKCTIGTLFITLNNVNTYDVREYNIFKVVFHNN